ncbi:3-keto-steroid reductase [Grifola frondosa]|uniref:3beta-hydroxysteroid 3-dehydrogenase n=1 Tax=Grifola frondosa TaxID=5627 RepID=A0A1C7LWG8_GRIFR|nr:3-keto-steroid reductase [Grifola frondosa]
MSSKELIIVVTGANGGVGYGICQRLMIQLSQLDPADARPVFPEVSTKLSQSEYAAFRSSAAAGVTIIMACRDLNRAEVAKTKLYVVLDDHIKKLPEGSSSREYATRYRANFRLAIHRYPHISHLICNAGTATYSHLDIWAFTMDLLRAPVAAIEHPNSNIQRNGVLSSDNLGYTWQCNVFGHYVLFRTLQPLLSKYCYAVDKASLGAPARVLWMSSLESRPMYDPANDWQLIKTNHSYQASKYQMELICAELSKNTEHSQIQKILHFIVSPGITSTNMSTLLNIRIPFYRTLMLIVFYVIRLLGSPNILFSVYKAAIAAVHIALVPLVYIPASANDLPPQVYTPTHSSSERAPFALRFCSQNDRCGREYVGIMPVPVWEEYPHEGKPLLERFERLYQTFVEAERGSVDPDAGAS